MALFARIFSSRKNSNRCHNIWDGNDRSKRWTSPSFDKDNVRVVIFRDHDIKGRSLIYDSSVVVPIVDRQACQKWPFGKTTPCWKEREGKEGKNSPHLAVKHTPLRQLSDSKMLGEMMFGSVAMAYRGTTLKVHSIRTPPQIMVTEVFIVSRTNKEHAGGHESFDGLSTGTESSCPRQPSSCESMDSTDQCIAHSLAVNVPMSQAALEDGETEDSGFSASVTSSCSSFNLSYPSPGSSSSLGSVSFTSRQRRYRRNQATSLEHNLAKRCSDEMVSVPLRKRPAKFGLGIIFPLPENDPRSRRQFEKFFFSHITLITGHVFRLRKAVERALTNKCHFATVTIEGVDMFRSCINDLYTTPRLSQPIWLHMMTYSTHKVALCDHFLREFMQVFEKYDTKSTKFFLSTLVTAVLTNHLAWVPTVTPAGATPSRNYKDKHTARWMDALAKSHPYNPLWAQLGDLYGAVGFPLRLSRTVVTGKKVDVVSRFLNVLSYFIRCSEVHENRQGNGPFARDSDSEVATERLVEEGSVDGDGQYCDEPSRTKCDAGGSAFENDVRTPVLEGGCVSRPHTGQDSSDVTLNFPKMETSTVWYVDLPCEGSTDGRTSNQGNGGDKVTQSDVCHISTVQQSSGGKCGQVVHDCERISSITHTTSTSHSGSNVDVGSSTRQDSLVRAHVTAASGSPTWTCNETRAGENVCREQCDAVVTPSDCHSSHDRTAPCSPCDYKTDTTLCGNTRPGGHCDAGTVAECDQHTQTTALPQPLFLFRSFDQCQHICLPASGDDSVSDPIHSQCSSLGRQKSDGSDKSESKVAGDSDGVSDTVSSTTETSVEVDIGGDTQVSPTDVSDVSEKCQLSPSFIREETRVLRVRLVGRRAPPEISETSLQVAPELHAFEAKSGSDRQALGGDVTTQEDTGSTSDIGNSVGSQRCTDTSDSDSCLTGSSDYLLQVDIPGISQGSSPCMYSTQGKEGFLDSGMFEVSNADVVTYSDVTRTDPHDSGFSMTDCSESVEAEDTLVLSSHSETTEISSGASTLCHDRPTPSHFTFSRSNSMFDEYFRDDTADGATALPVQSTVDEISADVFSEYLDAPMPDANELRKFSVRSQMTSSSAKPCYACLPSMEESPSMFDEYFADESNKSEHSLAEDTAKKRLDFEVKKQSETLMNDAATERSDAGVRPSVRQKHRSEEMVPRKNSLQHAGNVLLGRQISTPAPCVTTSRTRPTTPTEFVRRRHMSTVSGASVDSILNLTEVPMPRSEVLEDTESALMFNRNFGSSLIAGYSDHYLSDFVLHGTSNTTSNFHSRLHADLTHALQNSVLDEPIAETVCIIADTDKWTVRRSTCHFSSSDRVKTQDVTESNLVYNILESVHDLWKLKMSPEFCLMHLEDRLQEIYFKSKMLSEYLCVHRKLCMKELSQVLGIDKSDIPLLLAVAGTHTSHLAMGLL